MSKTPILTPAYKVVQVSNNRYFSVNSNSDDLVKALKQPCEHVVEYKLKQIAYPQRGFPKIFVCGDVETARIALSFYERNRNLNRPKDLIVFQGWAANAYVPKTREVHVNSDTVVFVPESFTTTLCDWFIPTKIVRIKARNIA